MSNWNTVSANGGAGGNGTWVGLVAGGGGAAGGGTISRAWIPEGYAVTMSDSVFSVRSPKLDSIKAVKLTHDNIRDVGAVLLKRGFKVAVNLDITVAFSAVGGKYPPGTMGVLTIGSDEFLTGEWLVEEFDYVENKAVFRKASVGDRQKYDLR